MKHTKSREVKGMKPYTKENINKKLAKKKIQAPRCHSKSRMPKIIEGVIWFAKDGYWKDKPHLKRFSKHMKVYE